MGEDISEIYKFSMALFAILAIGMIVVIMRILMDSIKSSQSELVHQINEVEDRESEAKTAEIPLEAIQETVTEKVVVHEIIREVEKPVVTDITGIGVTGIGIGLIIFAFVVLKSIKRWVEFKKEKLKKYEEIMTKPLDTFGDSSLRELENKYK